MYLEIASPKVRSIPCAWRHSTKSGSFGGIELIAKNLKATGGTVLILASVKDFAILLVSSIRIGLASRVLLVQANTGSCVVGEPAWVVKSKAGQ
jgi:hypothetical protein